MIGFRIFLACTVLVPGFLQTADLADAQSLSEDSGLPDGVEFLTPQEIEAIYYDKTQTWSWGSYGYWGPDQSFRSVNEPDTSIGVGEWYVTDIHQMCFEVTWHWLENFGTANKTTKTCYQFAHDTEGRIWRRKVDETRAESWLPFEDFGFRKGDRTAAIYRRLARELNLLPDSE